MQEYLTYICDDLLTNTLNILKSDSIDTSDETYKAWKNDESISLKDYLNYAASQNWIDISQISTSNEYLDSEEIYQALTNYIIDYLKTDTGFSKLLYKYMLQEDTISGEELCVVLYEQEFFPKKMSCIRQCFPEVWMHIPLCIERLPVLRSLQLSLHWHHVLLLLLLLILQVEMFLPAFPILVMIITD